MARVKDRETSARKINVVRGKIRVDEASERDGW